MSATQEMMDNFYRQKGPCCAGCDHWRWVNSVAGLCTQSKIVPSKERGAMFEISSSTLNFGAGHVMTKREYVCGLFRDQAAVGSAPTPPEVK